MPRPVHEMPLFDPGIATRDSLRDVQIRNTHFNSKGHYCPPIPQGHDWEGLRGKDLTVRSLGPGRGVEFMGKRYHYPVFYKPSDWKKFLYEVVGLPRSVYLGTREHNQFAAWILRTKPSSLVKGFNKVMLETWVDPIRPLAEKYCSLIGYKRGWDPRLLRSLWGNRTKVSQALSDKQGSLVPFILNGHDLKAVKNGISKKKWKRLCNNSTSRNQRLAHLHIDDISDYMEVPTTLLRQLISNNPPRLPACGIDGINWFLSNYKSRTTLDNKPERIRMMNIFIDTQSMATQLGEEFNPKWSYRRMEEQHEKFTQAIHRRKYSDQPFPWMELLPEEVKEVEYKGYKAMLLDNALAIRDEGSAMHHCVGGYTQRCAKAMYMVYSITKDGKRVSTLGIRVDQRAPTHSLSQKNLIGGYRLNQHYGYCNSHVSDEDALTLESKVLMRLKNMSEKLEDE
jgi:hypothetical protein